MPGTYTRKCSQQCRKVAQHFSILYDTWGAETAVEYLKEALDGRRAVFQRYVLTDLRKKYPELDL